MNKILINALAMSMMGLGCVAQAHPEEEPAITVTGDKPPREKVRRKQVVVDNVRHKPAEKSASLKRLLARKGRA